MKKSLPLCFIHCGGDQSGEQNWRPEHNGMAAASLNTPHRSRTCGCRVERRPAASSGKADALWEEMGICTIGANRGMGPGIQGRISRDNAGKGHLPAGACGNLQRPADQAEAEGSRRVLVWRMSPYERRRGGNAFRHDAPRRHVKTGNTCFGRRGSRHMAVRKRNHRRTQCLVMMATESSLRAE